MKYTPEQKAELKKRDIDKFHRKNKPKPIPYVKDGSLIIQSKIQHLKYCLSNKCLYICLTIKTKIS